VDLIDLDAPAKVNLGLRVVGRRADGYHELESLFVPVDLVDAIALRVERADAAQVSLALAGETPGAPPGDDNLAVRAARAFLARSGIAARVTISLTKRTPVAAGLGGGSSDAAAVLRGLAQVLPGRARATALEEIALGLGADVPFFLDPRPAWVTGIGEKREPIPGMPALALVLANPGLALATAEVFRAFDALAPKAIPSAGPPRALASELADDRSLAARLHNDLEEPAVRLCPPIARLRARLRATGARAVGMSGSGATLYGVYRRSACRRARRGGSAQPDRGLGPGRGDLRIPISSAALGSTRAR
jgi:4-diphosphocytidyl-2-C-methyl-D-erythritol kinase